MAIFKGRFGAQAPSLTQGSVVRCILSFSMPIFLGQLLQQLSNLADAWVLGNFAPDEAFAAVSSGGSLTFLVTGFFNGVAIGGSVIISRYFGAGDEVRVSRSIHTLLACGLVSGLVITGVGVALTPTFLVWMQTDPDVLPEAISYFRC